MSKMIIAHYFLADAQAPANSRLPEAVSLKINQGEVKFFQPPLIEEDSFLMFSEHLWRLDFFQQSEFSQTLWVKLVDVDTSLPVETIKDSLKPRVKTERIKFTENKTLGYGLFMVGNIEHLDAAQIAVISQILRGSNTLTAEAFNPLGVDSQLFMDGRGFALVTTNPLKLTNFINARFCLIVWGRLICWLWSRQCVSWPSIVKTLRVWAICIALRQCLTPSIILISRC